MADDQVAAAREHGLATANMVGIAAMVAAMAAIIVNDVFVKLAASVVPVSQLMVVRGLMVSVLIFVAAWRLGMLRPLASVWSPSFGWRLVGESLATVTFITGLVHMPFAEANAILQFLPLTVTAGSAIFLGERVGWRRWLAAVVGLLGVLLIIRPGTAGFNVYSLFIVACVLLVTLRDLMTRRIATAIPTLMLALTSALAVTATGLVWAPFETWVWPSPYVLLLLLAAAVFLSAGYVLSTIAVRTGEIGVVMPFRYSVVLFAIVGGMLVWGEVPDAMTLLGIGIVIFAGLYTFHRERQRLKAMT